VPDISLNESGQTNGDREGMWFVVDAVGAVYSGLGKRFSVSRSWILACNYHWDWAVNLP
jgi:hypothetical protein